MQFPTILVFYHFLGAVITSTRVSKKLGAYFSTFGGNPVSCAIGLAVLDVINNENLMSSARNVGKMLQDQLSELRVRTSNKGAKSLSNQLFLLYEYPKLQL